MHRSRIPGVESRLGSTWHRLNHDRAIKPRFQQCWTVKPERIQTVRSKIHQFLRSGWKLTVCFLWVCLLTLSPGLKAVFLSIWVEWLTISTCSQLRRESSGGTLLVPPGRVARGHPFPQPSLPLQCSSQSKTTSANTLDADISIALKNGAVLKRMHSHTKRSCLSCQNTDYCFLG